MCGAGIDESVDLIQNSVGGPNGIVLIAQDEIVGASEKFGGSVKERLTTPLDVMATIYHALGINLGTHYVDASGRPVSIVDGGKPVHELF